MRLIRTLSESLARTRDAQQFQVQLEVALLAACDVESRPAAAPPLGPPQPAPSSPEPVASEPTSLVGSSQGGAGAAADEPQPIDANANANGNGSANRNANGNGGVRAPGAPPIVVEAPAMATTLPATADVAAVFDAEMLTARWPDVVDIVKIRNPILASLLGSASPSHLEDNLLVVIFGTEFNRKSAEKATHRQIIETAFERVYGSAYRLRCTVRSEEGGASLLEDPVINYATRTFGGQPRRVVAERPGL